MVKIYSFFIDVFETRCDHRMRGVAFAIYRSQDHTRGGIVSARAGIAWQCTRDLSIRPVKTLTYSLRSVDELTSISMLIKRMLNCDDKLRL